MTRAPRRGITLSSYRRITLLALLALAVIVVSGAAVRLTGSGLGCDDWPRCTQKSFVSPNEFHARIEFINRAFTGVVSVAVILAVLGSLLLVERRRDLTLWSLGLVGGVIGQIVLGGLVVLFDLSPWLVIGHFLLSMALVWNAVVLHHRARLPAGRRTSTLSPRLTLLTRAVLALSMIVIVTGTVVTGSGPHSGAHGDQIVKRLPFAVHSVVRVHGTAMVAFLAATIGLSWMLRPGSVETNSAAARRARADISVLLVVLVAQAAVGYIQYFSDVPPLLVAIHVAGATTLWITVVSFYLRRFAPEVAGPLRAEPSGRSLVRSSHPVASLPNHPVASLPNHLVASLPSHLVASLRSHLVASLRRLRSGTSPQRLDPMAAPTTSPVELDEPEVESVTDLDRPWLVIVWNDPINLMSYVTFVLQKLFGYSRTKAEKLMLDVHEKGRAMVSSGSQEKAELDVSRLHEHGLWATMEQDS